jgi:hypothetical protein
MAHVFRRGVITEHLNISDSARGIPFKVRRSISNRNHDQLPETSNLVNQDQPYETRTLHTLRKQHFIEIYCSFETGCGNELLEFEELKAYTEP